MFGRLGLFIILNSIMIYLLDSRQNCSAMYDTKKGTRLSTIIHIKKRLPFKRTASLHASCNCTLSDVFH